MLRSLPRTSLRSLLRIALVFTIFTVAPSLHAQPFWQQTNGPAGSEAWSMTQMPSGDLFVLSDLVFHSSDKGSSWRSVSKGLPFGIITSIHATSRGVLLALKYNGYLNGHAISDTDYSNSIYISLDKGETWRKQPLSRWIYGATSTSDGTIYLSSNDYTLSESVIFRSTDNGASWDTTVSVGDDEVFAGDLFADSSGIILSGNHRTTDRGKSWSKLLNGFPGAGSKSGGGESFVIDRSTIYAQGRRSKDAGRTWQELSAYPYDVSAVDAAGGLLDLTTNWKGPVIHYSISDLQTRWPTVNPPSTGMTGTVRVQSSRDGDLYYTTFSGFYRLPSHDSLWQSYSIPTGSVRNVVAHPGGMLIASTECAQMGNLRNKTRATWYSDDQGMTWKQSTVEGERKGLQCFAIDSSGKVLGGGAGEIFVSTDQGRTFKTGLLHFDNTQDYATSIAVSPAGYIYVGTGPQGVFRSTDNGVTWDQLNSGLKSPVYSLGVDRDGKVYAGSMLCVYVSTDNGLNWTQQTSGLPAVPAPNYGGMVTSLVVNNQGYLLAGIDSFGMYVSLDDGANWQPINGGLGDLHITALLNTPSDKVFAATRNGVYYLESIASYWVPAFSGMAAKSALSLTRNADGYLFVGTEGAGVLRSTIPFNAPHGAVREKESINISVSPNPASNTLTITSSEALGQLELVSVTGVSYPLTGASQATSSANYDITDIPNGVYILRSSLGHVNGSVVHIAR